MTTITLDTDLLAVLIAVLGLVMSLLPWLGAWCEDHADHPVSMAVGVATLVGGALAAIFTVVGIGVLIYQSINVS